MRKTALRHAITLMLIPTMAQAGVFYDLTVQPIDPADVEHATGGPPAPPTVSHYYVEGGKVRISTATARTLYLFEDRTLYVIDNPAKTVHLLKHATLDQVAAHYTDTVRGLEEAAARAPPDERAQAERKAADMKVISDRMLAPLPRAYKVTVRFETVEGRSCRIWEERENDAKRLELCVAPLAAVPGGAQILDGLKTLSRFREGSDFALGVDFALSDWWADFASVVGVPLMIREYKYDLQISTVTLTSIRQVAPGDASTTTLWELPAGYAIQEGPDYAQWYLR